MANPRRKAAAPRRSRVPAAAQHPLADQPAANPERGEHELTLAGITYRLRPSHGAIQAIEKKTERSLLTLLRLGSVGELMLDQVAEVAAELIRAGAEAADQATRHVGAKRVGELIFEEGLPRVMARLTLCLADAASGGRDAEGNAKAAPVMMTNEAAGAA